MSTKGRIKANISWTVVSALALLVLVLLSGVFHSCCPASENNSAKVINKTEVKADRYKVVDASSNRLIANIFVFDLENLRHRIIADCGGNNFSVDVTHCDEMDRTAEFKEKFAKVNVYDSALIK